MFLSTFLHPELFWTNIEIQDERLFLERVIKTIRKEFSLSFSDEEIVSKLLEREISHPTLLGNCFWVPHLRLPDLEDLIIAVSLLKKPFVFSGGEVKGVFVILTGPSRSNLYLNALAAIAQVAGDASLLAEIFDLSGFDPFCRLLDRAKISIKKELSIRDIMSSEVHTVRCDQNLEEVLDLFAKYQISYAPVVDENGRFVAEINMIDIMKVGMPHYTTTLPNMSFLFSFEPFEELLKHERDILVRQIMRKPDVILAPETSLVEAVFEFTNHRRRHLPVAEKEKVVGVVSYMDMLNKVLRR